MATESIMTLVIQTPEGVVWQGEVSAISAKNKDGPFTIWPDHANFITPLHAEPVEVTYPDGTTQTYTYEEAVLFLQDNLVKLYVQEAALTP